MSDDEVVPEGVDATRPSPARLYDYYLGGTHNFAVDRQAAESMMAVMPELRDAAWANRGFHGQAAAWMARRGIRQFLDIGSGLPTQNNTHQTVRRVIADARVVYADIDPMVTAYGAALLAGDGSTALIEADLRDPDTLLGHPELRRLIDPGQPTGVLMTLVLHFIADSSDPWGLVARYMAAMAPDSCLAVSHVTFDRLPPRLTQVGQAVYARATSDIYPRTADEVSRLFAGLDLVPPQPGAPPGITYGGLWGAEDVTAADSDGGRTFYCGVARRP
jgi:hypothetical protein